MFKIASLLRQAARIIVDAEVHHLATSVRDRFDLRLCCFHLTLSLRQILEVSVEEMRDQRQGEVMRRDSDALDSIDGFGADCERHDTCSFVDVEVPDGVEVIAVEVADAQLRCLIVVFVSIARVDAAWLELNRDTVKVELGTAVVLVVHASEHVLDCCLVRAKV